MPSVIEPQQTRGTRIAGHTNAPSKRNTLQNHFEKTGLPPQLPKGKFQEKAGVAKRSLVQPVPLKSSKPWPGSDNKATSSKKDELIKHMSNVPSYLQRTDHNGDNNNNNNNNNNIQGKALNFGVLEWGALEKYTTQKHRDVKSSESFIKKPHLDMNTNSKFKSKKQEGCAAGPSSSPDINGENGFDLCESHLKTHNGMNGASASKKKQSEPIHGADFSSSIRDVKYKESCKPQSHLNLDKKANKKEGYSPDSCESPLNNYEGEKNIGKNQSSFSGEFIGQTPRIIPISCPLPCELLIEEAGTCSTNNTTKNRENARTVIDPLDRVSLAGFSQMNRCSSLKERPSNGTPPSILFSEKINPDRESSNKRGRQQSPLRRMLEPLLKPKNPAFNKESINKESGLLNISRRSLDGRENSTGASASTGTSTGIGTTYFQHEKKEASSRQALLQLAWKNGLPLFMLSSGDSDILAATLRTQKDNNNNNSSQESVYSIFTVQESKKKGSVMWIKQGNKNKKQQLVSNVVGEVRMSLSKSKCGTNSQNYHFSRQFILVSSNNSDSDSESPILNHSELAAIITNLPQRDCLCFKTHSVSAILPSGIHGNSNSGEPLPLIERWKMGGGCDCGGWDEGCMLTILTDEHFHEINDSSSQRFELFTQGRSKEEGCAFSMICFKEGLYTVEFKSSVDLLQAFVICIAFLHGRNPVKQEIEIKGQEEPQAPFVRKSQASYVPHHPPLSPVGRA